MSFSNVSEKKEKISDAQLDEMLLSLREDENVQGKPPVVNIFGLAMEEERRRSRIQLEIVTIAAFVSVISTAVLTAVFFRFMLPDLIARSDSRTREIIFSFREAIVCVSEKLGGTFIAIALTVLLGYMIGGVLLIREKNEIFVQNK